MNRLGVAIIGTGAVSSAHILAYERMDEVEIRVLCDSNLERAQKAAQKISSHPKAVSDWQEILDFPEISCVSVCLPPFLHAEVAEAFLRAGKNVLVEKPMATSLEECDRMIAAGKASGKLLSVVCNNRFNTSVMRVKHILDSGICGRLLFTTVSSLWWRGANYYDMWWRGTWEKEYGGCTTSHAVHHLDLLQWMAGMPSGVQAVIGNLAHDNSECEDYACAVFRYKGSVAQFTTNLVSHGESQEIVFNLERASLHIPWQANASTALINGFPQSNDSLKAELESLFNRLPVCAPEGHCGAVHNFIKAVRGEEPLLVDGMQGRNTIEMITAIYQASVSGQPALFPISPESRFYRKATYLMEMPHFYEKHYTADHLDHAPAITFGRKL